MTRPGQITESEAIGRGLLRDARADVVDGRVRCSHAATGVFWFIAEQLPVPVAPAWRGGVPCP